MTDSCSYPLHHSPAPARGEEGCLVVHGDAVGDDDEGLHEEVEEDKEDGEVLGVPVRLAHSQEPKEGRCEG